MKLKKAIVYLVTLTIFSCSFVSCGNSSDSSGDKKASVPSEQSETKSAEERLLVGTWDFDPENYEGMEFEGAKLTLIRLKFSEDNKAVMLMEMDYSDITYLTDKKLYIGGRGYKIKSFDRKELVIDIGSEEITFVRTSESNSKYGEYEFPEEWVEEIGADKATVIFEDNEKTKVKAYGFGEYEYDSKSGEISVDIDSLRDDDDEDDDDYNGPATIEFLDEDTILLHGSAGEDVKMFRVK